MAIDRPETNFKGPRSFSNQFGRFFIRKILIGHFDRPPEITFFMKNRLSMRKCKKTQFTTFQSPITYVNQVLQFVDIYTVAPPCAFRIASMIFGCASIARWIFR